MKRFSRAIFILLILHTVSHAQAPDVPCATGTYYGIGSNYVHKISFNGTTLTDLGAVTNVSAANIYSLAYAEDITANSTNRVFYSSRGTSAAVLLRYNGTSWDSIGSAPMTYSNCGGRGKFIYYLHNIGGGQANNGNIARLHSDGTLHPIFTDTSLVISSADLAIDSLGRIWFFRGNTVGHTTEITVIDSIGTILQSIPTTVNNLSNVYGLMFFNGKLHMGQGTTGAMMYPITISGNTATLGSPVSMPASMIDLANCYELESPTGMDEQPAAKAMMEWHISDGQNVIVAAKDGTLSLYALNGSLVATYKVAKQQPLHFPLLSTQLLMWRFDGADGQAISGKQQN